MTTTLHGGAETITEADGARFEGGGGLKAAGLFMTGGQVDASSAVLRLEAVRLLPPDEPTQWCAALKSPFAGLQWAAEVGCRGCHDEVLWCREGLRGTIRHNKSCNEGSHHRTRAMPVTSPHRFPEAGARQQSAQCLCRLTVCSLITSSGFTRPSITSVVAARQHSVHNMACCLATTE